MKNVQIPQELFMKLLRYHLLDDGSCADDVKKGLEQKIPPKNHISEVGLKH